jgi:hypothetical protein
MKYARIALWCIIGIGVAAFFCVLSLWHDGKVSDSTARVVFGSAVVPALMFFMSTSAYLLFQGFRRNEVILMGRYSAASFSRSQQRVRYWIAIVYHLTICVLSVYAAQVVIAEIMK